MTGASPKPASALLDMFDHVYIINLKERADRRREMAAELARIGVAIDDPRITVFPAVRPPDAGVFPGIGARGCYESHLGVLDAIVARAHARALILEDDVDFAPAAAERIARVGARLRSEAWDLVYGGTLGGARWLDGDGGLYPLDGSEDLMGLHIIGVTADCAAAAAAHLRVMMARPYGDARGGPMHVDGAYNWFRRDHPERRCFLAVPFWGHQRPSASDIHEHGGLRSTLGRTPIAGLVRRVKRALRRHED